MIPDQSWIGKKDQKLKVLKLKIEECQTSRSSRVRGCLVDRRGITLREERERGGNNVEDSVRNVEME